MRWRRGRRGGQSGEVYRITGAPVSLSDDVRGRQRRYVVSMLIRTVAVVLTLVLWNVSRPLAVVALVLGAVLPYVAVVMANAGRENASSLPGTAVENRPDSRPALPPGAGPGPAPGRAGGTGHTDLTDRREEPGGTAPGTAGDGPGHGPAGDGGTERGAWRPPSAPGAEGDSNSPDS